MARKGGFEGLAELSSGEAASIRLEPGELDNLFYILMDEQPGGSEGFRGSLAIRWQVLDDWVLAALHKAGLPALGGVRIARSERLDSGLGFRGDLVANVFLKARVHLVGETDGAEYPLTFFYDTEPGGQGGWLGRGGHGDRP